MEIVYSANGSSLLNGCMLSNGVPSDTRPDPWEDDIEKKAFLTNYASQHPDEDMTHKDVAYLLPPELFRHIAWLGLDETDDPWRNGYAQVKFRQNTLEEHPSKDIKNMDVAHTLSLEVAHAIAGEQHKLNDEKMRRLLNLESNFRLVDRYTNRSVERKLDREIIEASNGKELSDEARQRAYNQFEYIKANFSTSDPFYRIAKKKYNALGF